MVRSNDRTMALKLPEKTSMSTKESKSSQLLQECDNSFHSTVSVPESTSYYYIGYNDKSSAADSTYGPSPHPQRVKFATRKKVYIYSHNGSSPSDDSKQRHRELWYSPEELAAIKADTCFSAPHCKRAVRDVYIGCRRGRCPTIEQNRSLTACYEDCIEQVLGLEHQLLGSKGAHSLAFQRRALFNAIQFIEKDKDLSVEEKIESMGRTSLRMSRLVRVFAAHIAMAAAAAATETVDAELIMVDPIAIDGAAITEAAPKTREKDAASTTTCVVAQQDSPQSLTTI